MKFLHFRFSLYQISHHAHQSLFTASPRVYPFLTFPCAPSSSRTLSSPSTFLQSFPRAASYLFHSLSLNDTEPRSIFPPNGRTRYHSTYQYHTNWHWGEVKLMSLALKAPMLWPHILHPACFLHSTRQRWCSSVHTLLLVLHLPPLPRCNLYYWLKKFPDQILWNGTPNTHVHPFCFLNMLSCMHCFFFSRYTLFLFPTSHFIWVILFLCLKYFNSQYNPHSMVKENKQTVNYRVFNFFLNYYWFLKPLSSTSKSTSFQKPAWLSLTYILTLS